MSKAIALPKNGTVALSDMNVPQLTAANTMLDRIAGNHDHAHTTARLLQGVTLLEIKRRLHHGEWGPFLKKSFDKSQDSAGRYIRAAEDFLAKLQDAKFRKRAEFNLDAAVSLLRQDLGKTLEQLEDSKLDLSNPIVQLAAFYAGGRSFNQLLLELGDAQRGGKRTAGKKLKKSRDEIAREEAQITYLPLQKALLGVLQAKPKRRLLFLPLAAPETEASLSALNDALTACSTLVQAAIKQARRGS
jgi:hypothetical protein